MEYNLILLGQSFQEMMIPLVIIVVLFYFLIVQPERKRQQQADELRENLRKNDQIITIGGIYGTVVNAGQGEEPVTIRIDDKSGTRIRIKRSAILQVVQDTDGKSEVEES